MRKFPDDDADHFLCWGVLVTLIIITLIIVKG